MIKLQRFPIILFAFLCLLAGILTGLTRIGWPIAVSPANAHHGSIMVSGFLGTLIILEKIIPHKQNILLLIPGANALSVPLFFFGYPDLSVVILLLSSTALAITFAYYYFIQRTIIYTLMFIGALCWLTGNIMLTAKWFYPLAFPWWAAFALFIISAERIELMKFLPVSKISMKLFAGALLVFPAGVLLSFHGLGGILCGSSLITVSLWLLRNDLIGINLRKEGIQRFVAISLLTGYMSLLLTGIFVFILPDQWLTYDAIVHCFFLGFVFSMIFAHGPIILPGVIGAAITPFSRILYLWLTALHISWIMRVFADIAMEMELRKISGLLSAIAIVGYFITLAMTTIRKYKHAQAV